MSHVIKKITHLAFFFSTALNRCLKNSKMRHEITVFSLFFSNLADTVCFHAFHFVFQVHSNKITYQKRSTGVWVLKKQRPNTIQTYSKKD